MRLSAKTAREIARMNGCRRNQAIILWQLPTVLRREGYEIVIYFNDHVPPHVHVFKGAGEVRIYLDPVVVTQIWNMKKRAALRARRIIT